MNSRRANEDAADDDDETGFWLAVPGIRESIAQSDDDIAAGRTYGEAEIRAELTAADADYAPLVTPSAERN